MMSDLHGKQAMDNDPFSVFETEVVRTCTFLVQDFGFRQAPPRRSGRSSWLSFRLRELTLKIQYEFGESLSITFLAISESTNSSVSCTIHEAMRVRCPQEDGWPYRRELPVSWPKSSDLKSPEVISSLLENYARVLRDHFVDILHAESGVAEFIVAFRRGWKR